MRMPFPRQSRSPAVAAALVLALGLSACASRNPLMDDGAKPAPAARAEAAKATETAAARAPAPAVASGVEVTRERRFLFGLLTPYRPEIQQGNFVSEEMVAQLREGMTPDQVRFVLGTPLLTDIFHGERWDYMFRLVKRNGETTTSRVQVYFKDNRLVRFDGGDLPTEQEYLARLTDSKATPKRFVPKLGASPAPVPTSSSDPK